MIFLYLAATLMLALLAKQTRDHLRDRRQTKAVNNAWTAGIEFDAAGNVHAAATYETLSELCALASEPIDGKQAEFMEVTRLIAHGPGTPDEIRFLIARGYEPVVRPDGLVYVPCAENDSLFMDGEIPLVEDDLAVLEQ